MRAAADLRTLLGRMVVFERVASLGSFKAAGEELRLARSAVSHAVATLEAELGARLLHRTTRSVACTPAGRAFRNRCETIVREGAEALQELEEHVAHPTGVLRVTAPVGPLSEQLVAPVVAELIRAHGLRAELRVTDDRLDLGGGEVDVAVRLGTPRSSTLKIRSFRSIEHVFVAAPDLAETIRGEEDLVRVPFVRHLRVRGAYVITRPDGSALSFQPDASTWVGDVSTLLAMVRCGAGMCMIPRVYALGDIRAGTLVRVLEDYQGPAARLFALMPAGEQMPARTRRFLDALAEHVQAFFREQDA